MRILTGRNGTLLVPYKTDDTKSIENIGAEVCIAKNWNIEWDGGTWSY